MLKLLRKYNKWILVIGGSLLLMAFLIPQTIQQFGQNPLRRTVARIDGVRIRGSHTQLAIQELVALRTFFPMRLEQFLGVKESDELHWFLLTHEAHLGGFIGEGQDGADWQDELVRSMADEMMNRQYGIAGGWRRLASFSEEFGARAAQQHEELLETVAGELELRRIRGMQEGHLNHEQFDLALAKARGVYRMLQAYERAARLSVPRAVASAAEVQRAAYVDAVFIPADRIAPDLPEPAEGEILEHFERFRRVDPGESEYGIGYRQPDRVKLEWLVLGRQAVENAVVLDPVDVRKRYQQQRDAYPGDFASERQNVERDMRAALTDGTLREAHIAIQAEVLRATRRLPTEGRFKRLGPDWEEHRPRMEDIAQAVVEQVRLAAGVDIALPAVSIRASEWLRRDDLPGLPGIGPASVRQGALRIAFDELIFSAREFDGRSPIAVQAGVPIVETPLLDGEGNRYYIAILEARPESPAESPDDVRGGRERVLADLRLLHAYERLGREADRFAGMAATGGLEAVVEAIGPEAEEPAYGPSAQAEPTGPQRLEVHRRVVIRHDRAGNPDLDHPGVRTAILDRAATIDPLRSADEAPITQRTLAIPAPSRLGLVVARIEATEPLTRETFSTLPEAALAPERERPLRSALGDTPGDSPFSLARLKQRYSFRAQDDGAEREFDPADPAG